MSQDLLKPIGVLAMCGIHYAWLGLWIQQPPVWAVYSSYLIVAGVLLVLLRRIVFSRSVLLNVSVGVFVGFTSAVLSMIAGEVLVGRGDRLSLGLVNAYFLIRMPLRFLGWVHIPIMLNLLQFRVQKATGE